MIELRELTDNDLEIVNSFFQQCEGNNGREVCPKCNIRHTRLPNAGLFASIVNQLDNHYTHQAFASVWGVSREAVRLLWTKAFSSDMENPLTKAEFKFGTNLEEQVTNAILQSKDDMFITGDKALCKKLNIPLGHLNYLKRNSEHLSDALKEQYEKNRTIPKEYYTCYRCHETLAREKFHNSKRFADGVSRTCKECSKAGQKKYYKIRYNNNTNGDVFVESKRCPRCEQTKPASSFHKSRGIKDGLQAQCKSCQIELRSEFYTRNRQEQST